MSSALKLYDSSFNPRKERDFPGLNTTYVIEVARHAMRIQAKHPQSRVYFATNDAGKSLFAGKPHIFNYPRSYTLYGSQIHLIDPIIEVHCKHLLHKDTPLPDFLKRDEMGVYFINLPN